jgi:hypothetical protein
MLDDASLKEFLVSPVMIIIGTCNEHLMPAIGRGLGARILDDALEVLFSAWQWPATAANLRNPGTVAITFARPSDYVSYQLKGAAALRPATAADVELCERYRAGIRAAFVPLGMDLMLTNPWLTDRDLVAIRMQCAAAFVQTPGPKAGERLTAAS